MTKFQKQMLTIAAAGALTAVTALPAMAFENEFHGIFNFNTVFSNYNNGKSGAIFTDGNGTSVATALKKNNKTNNYMEQRARIQYIAKASDDLKLVTHFEMNNQYGLVKGTGTSGTQIDTDTYNIQLKHAYLDFNIGKNFNTVVGMLPYKDTLKGVFIDADVAAIYTTTKMGDYKLGLGFTRLNDSQFGSTTARTGDLNTDLFLMDNTYALNKDTKVGLSYYFLADYSTANQRTLVNTLGLFGETKLGSLGLSGFAAMQAGHGVGALGARTSYHGWAANVSAKMGGARTGLLFVSGDNNSDAGHNNGWVNTGVTSFNESGLMILTRNTGNSPTSTDEYIRRVVTNQALLYMGYDAKLTEKFNLDGAVGFAWAPASSAAMVDGATTRQNSSDFMGTELSVTAGYQLYKNLKLQAQAGYMILGGYYKNATTDAANAPATPENPYTMRMQARYSF